MGDHTAIDVDIDAARAKGRDDVTAHGKLMMTYLGRVVKDWTPQDRVRSFKARFLAVTSVYAVPHLLRQGHGAGRRPST